MGNTTSRSPLKRRNRRRGRARSACFAAVRMAYRYPARPAGVAAAVVLSGLLLTRFELTHHIGVRLGVLGLLTIAGCTAWWWLRWVARPHSVKTTIRRRAEQDQHRGGVATRLDIAENASAATLRLQAAILRPSMAGRSWWERATLDPRQVGVEVARLGWGWWGERVWSSCEDATMRIGGPRTGKTLTLACHGLDAPGALITTSTRLDLAEMVHQTRAGRAAVHVFNPAGLGNLQSTLRWRILAGCSDFATAQRRAADLVPESFGEGERWDKQARRVLGLLLHAAETSGRSMRDVMRWITEQSPACLQEITTALMSVPGGGRDRAQEIRAFWGTYDRGRSSVLLTMATPLAWMSDDRARQLGDADRTDPHLLDISDLIVHGQTLHLIGHEDQTGLSPLIGALVAEIAHAARTLASHRSAGRLDPPLTMLLDEAALVCPVPLDRWTADMGGRGVTLHISVQSLSQLRQRWGMDGAGTILANVASFLVFGGSPTADDLRDISLLTGEHRMKVVGADHGSDSPLDGEQRGEYRWVPVLSPAQIRALEPFQVLLLRRGLHTLVGYTPTVSDRKGWAPVALLNATSSARGVVVPSADDLEAMLDETQTPSRPARIGATLNARRVALVLRLARLAGLESGQPAGRPQAHTGGRPGTDQDAE
jgi:type IV secretion system protein VirD4